MLLGSCLAAPAVAQQQPTRSVDDLDVTMQVIVDPGTKVPDEIVRRIPLPSRKNAVTAKPDAASTADKNDATDKGKEPPNASQTLGREVSEQAKERAREAAEQREQARRSEQTRERPEPPDKPRPTPRA